MNVVRQEEITIFIKLTKGDIDELNTGGTISIIGMDIDDFKDATKVTIKRNQHD